MKTVDGTWLHLRDVLADTGADISLLPRDIGELIVGDITKGKTLELRGVVPYAKLIVFIHEICFRLDDKEFCAPTALSESNDVLPILGRVKGLDLFETIFDKGSKTTMLLE